VERPHHLGRALHAVPLEEGEELVLFAQVVLVDLEHPVESVAERGLEALPFLARGRLADLVGHFAQ